MANVNDDGRVHASFIENFPGTAFTEVRFWPYDGGGPRQVLKQAMRIIEKDVVGKNVACNSFFSHLPNGRSFDAIWNDPTFFINWDPRVNVNFLGFTATSRPMEITISQLTLTNNAWFTAATIVHEMAHLNGAPGQDGSGNNAAEQGLKHCGFAHFFNPNAIGDNQDYAEILSQNRYV